jgi:4,4'-diaponeurosporenoate glycosyltransferase
LIEGWTKGFAAGAGQTPRARLIGLVAWMSLLMLPLVLLPFTPWAGALYLLCAVNVEWVSRQVGTFRWYTALLYPVPLCFFFLLFSRSAFRSGKQVTWKGRAIRAD